MSDCADLICDIIEVGLATTEYQKEDCQMNDNYGLSHSKRNCKYLIVFAPKYRRRVVYGR